MIIKYQPLLCHWVVMKTPTPTSLTHVNTFLNQQWEKKRRNLQGKFIYIVIFISVKEINILFVLYKRWIDHNEKYKYMLHSKRDISSFIPCCRPGTQTIISIVGPISTSFFHLPVSH